jgi:hypothetical protein
MSVTTFMLAEQLAALDQMKAIRAELTSPEFAAVLATLITVGRFNLEKWLSEVDPLIAQLEASWAARETSARNQAQEARHIRDLLAKCNAWLDEVFLVLRAAARDELPGADDLFEFVSGGASDIQNYRQAAPELLVLQKRLSVTPDLESLGFPEDFLTRGATLRDGLEQNRAQLAGARIGISVGADGVHEAMVKLARHAERLNDARELAMVRTGRELPGFDLHLVRAAVAPRRAPTPAAEPAPVTEPVTDSETVTEPAPKKPGL